MTMPSLRACAILHRHQRLKLRQENDALLLVRIRSGNERRTGRVGKIGWQMRHTSRNVEQVAGMYDDMMLQSVPIPGVGRSGQDVDHRFMSLMQVRPGTPPWRDRKEVHADAGRPYRLRRNALNIIETLPAIVGSSGFDDLAGGSR